MPEDATVDLGTVDPQRLQLTSVLGFLTVSQAFSGVANIITSQLWDSELWKKPLLMQGKRAEA